MMTNFNGFKAIVDTLGGIDIEAPVLTPQTGATFLTNMVPGVQSDQDLPIWMVNWLYGMFAQDTQPVILTVPDELRKY